MATRVVSEVPTMANLQQARMPVAGAFLPKQLGARMFGLSALMNGIARIRQDTQRDCIKQSREAGVTTRGYERIMERGYK
jgi:hypothetical protein